MKFFKDVKFAKQCIKYGWLPQEYFTVTAGDRFVRFMYRIGLWKTIFD